MSFESELRGAATAATTALVVANPVLRDYAYYSALLGLKVLALGPLTARQRFRKKVFVNPEDAKFFDGSLKQDDPDVERVRRAHHNDLENIPVFMLIGGLYTLTNPDRELALNLYRGYFAFRLAHTIVYAVYPVPQPARALCHFGALSICVFMGFKVLKFFY
ncbi:microsomal glutathione S-transferase 1-like [Schistocerca nitens]|uniref:microsomal glutathione S-transferase 1-like n=1 Tax=Schistocerca nitens TaxID=7011 RepID=UPI0021183E32|nr:microsomal glutathione S-transferase 1-like [Schistocerca nitens]